MKLTDGKRTIEIRMQVWEEGSGYGPDWSNDFFVAGVLPHDENFFYQVNDVDYCIDQAKEWEEEDENNAVFVEEIESPTR